MGIASELAEALGVRLVTTDLPEEALWIEDHGILLVDHGLTADQALAYLGGAILGH